MQDVEFKQGPLLDGWAIAFGVGLAAFGICVVVMDFDLSPAVAVGGVLFLIVGLILGLPRAAAPGPVAAAPVARDLSFAAPAPLMAAPAPVMSMAPVPMSVAPEAVAPEAPAPMMAAATRPASLDAARDGAADDLKLIKGVGPVLENMLHSLGYFHFDQIAAWTAEEIAWVDENLEGFKGRVTRDDWVPQARLLAAGGTTEFSRRVEDGEVY